MGLASSAALRAGHPDVEGLCLALAGDFTRPLGAGRAGTPVPQFGASLRRRRLPRSLPGVTGGRPADPVLPSPPRVRPIRGAQRPCDRGPRASVRAATPPAATSLVAGILVLALSRIAGRTSPAPAPDAPTQAHVAVPRGSRPAASAPDHQRDCGADRAETVRGLRGTFVTAHHVASPVEKAALTPSLLKNSGPLAQRLEQRTHNQAEAAFGLLLLSALFPVNSIG